MKTAKDYGEIPSYHHYPEIDECPYCGGKLERSHPAWSKTIVSMDEIAKVTNWGYRCVNRNTICPKPEKVYRSAMADGLTLKNYTFSLDVIVFIGQKRFGEHRSLSEIHQALTAEGVPISERRVTDYMGEYEVLLKCAQDIKLEKYREQMIDNDGIVLAIDGVQPEKGKPTLYIFRDVLSGIRLHAVSLLHNDTESLKAEMEVVDEKLQALEIPVQGAISDNQKAIRDAVAQVWPNVSHQLCQVHFLKAAQKLIREQDSSLAKELKKKGRGISEIEREIEKQIPEAKTQKEQQEEKISQTEQNERDRQVLNGYTDAIRAVLQIKGKAPYKLPGLEIYETLEKIEHSVNRCLENHDHTLLEKIQNLTRRRHQMDDKYQTVRRQQDWILGLAEILDVQRTSQGEYTQAGVEVAQEVEHFLDGLTALKPYYPEDESIIDAIIKRTKAWSPGLFNCYEIPAIPQTDNELEQYIGVLKYQRRRTTGHKNVADYITRHGPYAVFYDAEATSEETLNLFQQVSTEDFRHERECFRLAQANQRRIRSFRRNPDTYLLRLERLWLGEIEP